ncbi:MAG: hypothetical protein JWO37_3008 [Acidimicrobiales bacterium]|nr:hypothetical protein [Acidimicrobiales bacterium]
MITTFHETRALSPISIPSSAINQTPFNSARWPILMRASGPVSNMQPLYTDAPDPISMASDLVLR